MGAVKRDEFDQAEAARRQTRRDGYVAGLRKALDLIETEETFTRQNLGGLKAAIGLLIDSAKVAKSESSS